eukprot:jgi/Bigna1/133825/aug1.22_g8533
MDCVALRACGRKCAIRCPRELVAGFLIVRRPGFADVGRIFTCRSKKIPVSLSTTSSPGNNHENTFALPGKLEKTSISVVAGDVRLGALALPACRWCEAASVLSASCPPHVMARRRKQRWFLSLFALEATTAIPNLAKRAPTIPRGHIARGMPGAFLFCLLASSVAAIFEPRTEQQSNPYGLFRGVAGNSGAQQFQAYFLRQGWQFESATPFTNNSCLNKRKLQPPSEGAPQTFLDKCPEWVMR